MLDIDLLCNNIETVATCLSKRGTILDYSRFQKLNSERRQLIKDTEQLKAERNRVSKQIAELKKTGINVDNLVIAQRNVGNKIKNLELAEKNAEEAFKAFIMDIPNIPHASVPVGKNCSGNIVIKTWGHPTEIKNPLDHLELGKRLKILDLDRATKLSGSRFSLLKGLGAKLERALISLMADTHNANGWSEIIPPYLVMSHCMFGTGQMPKFEQDLFKTYRGSELLYLIPTAEVPLTNMYSGENLENNIFPIRHFASTPCFRSEAGSYGKDTKGIIRQHQFHKVELVSFVKPDHDQALKELEYLTKCAESVLEILELPYRRVELCTGDIGFSSQKTFDLEVWIPSQNTYREISSCSWFGDFQARRANIRYRGNDNKLHFVHTLNGSGLAVGRTWVAVLENYQQPDGSIKVPKALQSYMNCSTIE